MQRANQLHFCSMSACLYDNHDQWPSPLKLSSNHVQRSKKIPMMSKFISDIVKKFNNICVGQVNQVLSALKPQEKATFTAILLFYIYIYIYWFSMPRKHSHFRSSKKKQYLATAPRLVTTVPWWKRTSSFKAQIAWIVMSSLTSSHSACETAPTGEDNKSSMWGFLTNL